MAEREYLKIPTVLYRNKKYNQMDNTARIGYAVILGRLADTQTYGKHTDEQGRQFVYFPTQAFADAINVKEREAEDVLKALMALDLIGIDPDANPKKPPRIYAYVPDPAD